jgi:hypothetical protein
MDAVAFQANKIESALVEAMAQLNGSGSMTQDFSGGRIVAASLPLQALNTTNGRVTVAEPGSDAAVDVPTQVIKQFGGNAMVMLTSFNQSGVSVDGTVLAAPPVGVRLFAGGIERHDNFKERLHVRVVSAQHADGNTCAFWDDSRSVWSGEGLETIIAEDGSLWCSTPHLTVFGAVVLPVREVALAIVCSNVGVISLEGFTRLGVGDWWRHPAALFLWSLLVGAVCLHVIAWFFDHRALKSCQWHHERFLVCGTSKKRPLRKMFTGAAIQAGVLETLDKGFNTKLMEGQFAGRIKQGRTENGNNVVTRGRSERIISTVTSRTHQLAVGIVRHSVLAVLAHRTRIATDDLKHQAGATLNQTIEPIRRKMDVEFDQLFQRMHLYKQPFALFVAAHPFTGIVSFSIFTSKFMKSTLIASHLLGAAALSALFFSATGDVLSIATPAECGTEDNIWRSAAIGVISGLITSIPMVFVAAAMKRHFVLRECWDEAAKRRQLRRWRRKHRCILMILTLYNGCCTVFLATFLANIRPDDAQKWLESLGGVLMEDFLLQPMVVAIIYTLITAALVFRSPSLLEEVQNDLRILDEEAGAVSTAVTQSSLGLQTKGSHSMLSSASISDASAGSASLTMQLGSLSCRVSKFRSDIAQEKSQHIREFPKSAWALLTKQSHSMLMGVGVSDASVLVGTDAYLKQLTTHFVRQAPVWFNEDVRVSELPLDVADEADHQSSACQPSAFSMV